jgi:hypothetical protein
LGMGCGRETETETGIVRAFRISSRSRRGPRGAHAPTDHSSLLAPDLLRPGERVNFHTESSHQMHARKSKGSKRTARGPASAVGDRDMPELGVGKWLPFLSMTSMTFCPFILLSLSPLSS